MSKKSLWNQTSPRLYRNLHVNCKTRIAAKQIATLSLPNKDIYSQTPWKAFRKTFFKYEWKAMSQFPSISVGNSCSRILRRIRSWTKSLGTRHISCHNNLFPYWSKKRQIFLEDFVNIPTRILLYILIFSRVFRLTARLTVASIILFASQSPHSPKKRFLWTRKEAYV